VSSSNRISEILDNMIIYYNRRCSTFCSS